MLLRARTIVPIDGPPFADGAVRVEGNQITAVGRFADVRTDAEAVCDLGEVALLPGLINAHCHLDYTILRGCIDRPRSFTGWVQRINALKRSLHPEDYLESIERGFAQCRRWGTTTVCNIASFPELMPRLPAPPIRTWWFYEMIDIRHRVTTEEVVAGALMFFQQRAGTLASFGLSPHAPFTASLPLYQLANACAGNSGMPLTTHVAESQEEFEMFTAAGGPLYDFLASLQRPMGDCGRATPFAHLWHSGAINGQWLLAHMNELAESDFDLLAATPPGSRPAIVHCPGSHAYFRHRPFAWRRLHDLGMTLCVGTDSLASTDSLSLLGELRRLGRAEPWLSADQLLRTVTAHPARALGRQQLLGRIGPGALADLITVPYSGPPATAAETIVDFSGAVPWMMVDGRVCPPE